MGGTTGGPQNGVQPRHRGPDATGPGSRGGDPASGNWTKGMRYPTRRPVGTVYAWNRNGRWPLADAPGLEWMPAHAVVHADVWVYNHVHDDELVAVCVERTHYIGSVREQPAGWAAYGAFAFTLGKAGMQAQHYQSQQAAVSALVAAWAVRLMAVLRNKKEEGEYR